MDNKALLIGTGIGAGIGAMLGFMFDPTAGGRRRALVYDKVVRVRHVTGRAVNGRSRDLANRAYGLYAETRGLLGWSPRERATTV
jgi:gas vesicle protein